MGIWVIKHCKTSKATIFWFNNKDYQIIFQDSTELLYSKDNITYVNKIGERIYFSKDMAESQIE
jgi:arsenate reductase-like glutaredoxin family protein